MLVKVVLPLICVLIRYIKEQKCSAKSQVRAEGSPRFTPASFYLALNSTLQEVGAPRIISADENGLTVLVSCHLPRCWSLILCVLSALLVVHLHILSFASEVQWRGGCSDECRGSSSPFLIYSWMSETLAKICL